MIKPIKPQGEAGGCLTFIVIAIIVVVFGIAAFGIIPAPPKGNEASYGRWR